MMPPAPDGGDPRRHRSIGSEWRFRGGQHFLPRLTRRAGWSITASINKRSTCSNLMTRDTGSLLHQPNPISPQT